jgi:hypothetical protein
MRKFFSFALKYWNLSYPITKIPQDSKIRFSPKTIRLMIWTRITLKILMWLLALFLIANFSLFLKNFIFYN